MKNNSLTLSLKPRINTFVACELAQISQDGKVSLIGIFSRLNATAVPIKLPRFYLAGMIKGEPFSEHRVRFRIMGPSLIESVRRSAILVRLGTDGRANIFNELTNTTFKEFGEHRASITLDEDITSEVTFHIVKGLSVPQPDLMKRSSSSMPN